LFFSHPKDFTPVCTTELGAVAKLNPEFDKRGIKAIGLSVDSVRDHIAWSKDIEETQWAAVNFPMIGDENLAVAKLYGMLPAETSGVAEGHTAVDDLTVLNVYVIGPDKQIKLTLTYPMAAGRNFDEILRVIDSVQLTANHQVATPANWKHGDEVIIVPSVSDEATKEKYPDGWRSETPYLRFVPEPN